MVPMKEIIMYKSEQNVSSDTIFDPEGLVLDNYLDWSVIDNQSPILEGQEIMLANQEDTMDASIKYCLKQDEFIPVSPIGPPEREVFAGDLNFEVEICGADTSRSKFMYSHRLNRIYVDMGHGFSVQLKWDAAAQPYAVMFVRATPVFSDQAQAEKRVSRCIQHYHDKKNDTSMPESMRKSVLHSTRDVGTLDVFYCGGDSPDVWHSVLVRFTAPSTHAYYFACKNSCSSGINRRTIAIIFTLEDSTGKVYGRQSVGARVCSCPKRDMKHEEEEEEAPRGKRPVRSAAAAAAPLGKKIRLEVRQEEVDSDEIIQLPQIPIVGRRVFNTGLGVMLNMLEEKRCMAVRIHQPTEQLDASIAQLRQHLDNSGVVEQK